MTNAQYAFFSSVLIRFFIIVFSCKIRRDKAECRKGILLPDSDYTAETDVSLQLSIHRMRSASPGIPASALLCRDRVPGDSCCMQMLLMHRIRCRIPVWGSSVIRRRLRV